MSSGSSSVNDDHLELDHYDFIHSENDKRGQSNADKRGGVNLKRAPSMWSVQSVGRPIPNRGLYDRKEKSGSTILDSVICRVLIALLFIAIGITALWYSVYKSESDTQLHSTPRPTPSSFYNPFVNQISDSGTLLYETEFRNNTIVRIVSSKFYQDNDNQRVRLIVATSGDEAYREVFAFRKKAYLITWNGTQTICLMNNSITYRSLVNAFGDSRMEYVRSMTLDDYSVRVKLYVGHSVSPGSTRQHTVMRYVSMHGNVQYGWSGFPNDPKNGVIRFEYWFGPKSKPKLPHASHYKLPVSCGDDRQLVLPPM